MAKTPDDKTDTPPKPPVDESPPADKTAQTAPPPARPARKNPNQPMSQIDKRKELEDVASEVGEDAIRRALPTDNDKLKDQYMVMHEQHTKAMAEIKVLQGQAQLNASKLAQHDKLKSHLNQEMKMTEGKWRPLLGYHDEEFGLECRGAPIGSGKLAQLAIAFYSRDGAILGVTVTSEKVSIVDDGNGRWMLK